jgi:hypothetical protein
LSPPHTSVSYTYTSSPVSREPVNPVIEWNLFSSYFTCGWNASRYWIRFPLNTHRVVSYTAKLSPQRATKNQKSFRRSKYSEIPRLNLPLFPGSKRIKRIA